MAQLGADSDHVADVWTPESKTTASRTREDWEDHPQHNDGWRPLYHRRLHHGRTARTAPAQDRHGPAARRAAGVESKSPGKMEVTSWCSSEVVLMLMEFFFI